MDPVTYWVGSAQSVGFCSASKTDVAVRVANLAFSRTQDTEGHFEQFGRLRYD